MISSTTAPTSPVRERTKRRWAARHGVVERRALVAVAVALDGDESGSGSDETATSAVADARIERRVQHVDDQVHDHDEDGDDQHRALHHRIVARSDRGDDVAPDADAAEHRLGQHRAAQQRA